MSRKVIVQVKDLKVFLLEDGEVSWEAACSTSKFGLGMEAGSYKTPLGYFTVSEKIGEGQPIFTIFKGRQPVGLWDANAGSREGDLILTRILWLEGKEQKNENTKERYIYFHGTNQEHLIGTPASHGCVRLTNKDMLKLFSYVEVGDIVEIIA
ncbi:MAG: L,D-transpeptidase [Verrucomicrobiota bacterium]